MVFMYKYKKKRNTDFLTIIHGGRQYGLVPSSSRKGEVIKSIAVDEELPTKVVGTFKGMTFYSTPEASIIDTETVKTKVKNLIKSLKMASFNNARKVSKTKSDQG